MYIYVCLGGLIGSLLRFSLSTGIASSAGNGFPFGTLIVNVTGCFFLGWFTSGALMKICLPQDVMKGFTVGLIGSYTTFSTFSMEMAEMISTGYYFTALIYIFVSTIGGLLFVQLGQYLGAKLVINKAGA